MNDSFELARAEAPRRRAPRGRFDLATMGVALLALLVALHARFFPDGGRIEGRTGMSGDAAQSLGEIQLELRDLRATLGTSDTQKRTVADRLLLAENQALLLDETLGKIVAHVKSLEAQVTREHDAR